jgi:hypothetical protein
LIKKISAFLGTKGALYEDMRTYGNRRRVGVEAIATPCADRKGSERRLNDAVFS